MPNPGAAARLRAWKQQTVTIADDVKGVMPSNSRKHDKRFAGQTGAVVALNACLPNCTDPDLHDEIGVQLSGRSLASAGRSAIITMSDRRPEPL
jgi:hypothetical protein